MPHQPLTLRGVFDIDPHRLLKGLHGCGINLQLYEAFVTLTLTVYRKGCTCAQSTLILLWVFDRVVAQPLLFAIVILSFLRQP